MIWPVIAAVSLLYVFLATSGTFGELPAQTDYYDRMAEGFRAGQLHLREAPSPALLATDDPYADKYVQLGLWDASLYDGRYYFYWGPVPALVVLAIEAVTGMPFVNDQWLGLLFMLGRFYGCAALILALCRLRALSPPTWLVALAIAVSGLAGPAPFIVARPHVYEACLAAGQCFLVWGLWAAFHGLTSSQARNLWFLLAGGLWALALGSRVTTWVAVPPLVAITLAVSWSRGNGWAPALRRTATRVAREACAFAVPLATAVLAYGAYNYVRFDSPTEFGVRYQITNQKFWTHGSYVLPNLFAYLWAPLEWSCRFPFATSVPNRPHPWFLPWPPGYQIWERVSGVLVMAPWCYFFAITLLRLARSAWARMRTGASLNVERFDSLELWASYCALALLPTVIPALGLWEASMRYSGDALAGGVLGATLGAFWLVRRASDSGSRLLEFQATSLIVAAAAYTCVAGTFSALRSYDDPFEWYNPGLFHWLEATLSLCVSPE